MKKVLCLLCMLLMLTVCLAACKKDKNGVKTDTPIDEPTAAPTDAPTDEPTDAPTDEPTDAPTDEPTDAPTDAPTDEPTTAPSGYTISYVLNGGENDPSNKTSYTGRSTVYLNDATRTGFLFEGWYANEDFSGDRLYSIPKGTNRDIILYAKWQEVIINVTYHLGADDVINSTVNVPSFSYHETASLTLAEPVRSGYIFRGWYSSESMPASALVETISRARLDDVELWAKWEKAPDRWVTSPPSVLPDHDETVPAGHELIIDMSDGPTGGTGFATYYAGDRTPQFTLKENGDPVLYWADLLTKSQMRIFNTAHKDLSAYNGVEFWMYNANAHGGSFVFLLGNDNRAKVHLITLDWTGWKKIYIDFASPSMQTWTWQKNDLVYSTSQIDAFICLSTGWGANISDGDTYPYSYVYIDDIYAVGNGSIYQPDPASFTPSDFEAVKARWVELLVGTAALNGTDITVSNYADTMNTDAARTYLWSDKKTLTTEVGVYDNYGRVYDMARAWAMPGSTRYHDAALLSKIVSALTFLNEYDADGDGTPGCYGQNVSVSRPGNWWHWQIGTPEYLVNTLMLIEDAVDAAFIAQMLEPVDICSPVPAMTMANRTWIAWPAIGSALLAGSGERVVTDIQALITVFDHVTTGDGFYDDGSFIQHNKLSYINGYGTSYFGSISNEIYIFAGTAFDADVGGKTLSAYCTEQVMDELFNSWEPFIYRGTTMWTTSGRGMGVSSGAGTLGSVVQIIPYASTADAERFWSMVKYFETDAGTFSSIAGHVKTVAKPVYNAYAARTDVEPRSGYYFAHVYAAMDRVTARTESYTALLAMSSTRIYRFEAINNAGSSGWYLGDGVLLLHGGNASDYQSARYSLMDILRIPGTTVSSYKRENVGYTTDTGLLNRNAFVGGAYSDDYAAAAMFLAYSPADKMGNFVSDLVAQKAYFFFDDEIVCVGAGINADYTAGGKTNVGDVYTIIENVSGTGRTLFVNGRQTSLSENVETVSAGVGYATLSGWCGYVFPEAADVTMQRKSNGMFQMFINHGTKPVNAAYAYVMLPGASADKTAAYAAASDVEIVCASNIITHVVETTLGVEGYVFWYGTYYDGIRTSDGAIILRETDGDGRMTYRVSEPTQLLNTLTLTLDGIYTVTGENLTWSVSGGQTIVTLTTNGALGATFTFTVTPTTK